MRTSFLLVTLLLAFEAGAVIPQTGWWWNPQEGGSGLNLQFQRTVDGSIFMFAAGFVYDDSGNPVWFTASGSFAENDLAAWNETGLVAQFVGERVESQGGSCLTCSYVPPITAAVPGSEVRFEFTDTRNMEATFDGFSRTYQYFDVSNSLVAGLEVLDDQLVYVSAAIATGEVDGSPGSFQTLFTSTDEHTPQARIRKATQTEFNRAIRSELDDSLFLVESVDNDGNAIADGLTVLFSISSPPTATQVIPVALVLTYDEESNTAQMVLANVEQPNNRLDLVDSFDGFPRFRAFVSEEMIVGFAIPPQISNWETQDGLDRFGNNITIGSTITIYRVPPDDFTFLFRN